MLFRYTTGAIAALALGTFAAGSAFAQDTVKIGLIVAMTGPQASTGKEIKAAVDLYMKQHGDKVGEVYVFDDLVYIINDEVIKKAKLNESGELANIKESSKKEFEESSKKFKVPKSIFVKEKLFEELKKIFGNDIEIMFNY